MRRRPSGDGSNSRRFATVTGPEGERLKVPVVKDAATFIYVADAEGEWPETFATKVLGDYAWLGLGSEFQLEEMEPGQGMGTRQTVRVIDQRVRITKHRGRWGQLKRLVLVAEVPDTDTVAKLRVEDLEGGDG